LRVSTTLALPVAREPLFAFHTDPNNLGVLLEGWKATRVLATAGHIRPGARTEVLDRWGPCAFRLVFEHFLFEPPERFGERMVRGPFQRFEHVHCFRAADTGAGTPRTVIEEQLQLELPLRLGGDLALRLLVLPRLVRFFEFRRRAYERLAAEGRLGPTPESQP
jgi:ligand-binding SRPBCC domain-containing protein